MNQTSTPSVAREILFSALGAMPIFPLPGAVLFPGALTPLHVFEPRYRSLLAECMASHKCMALALLQEGRADAEGQPVIARVAGVGMIVECTALADGRSNIVLKGQVRVALTELPFVHPFRRAQARVLEPSETFVSALDAAALRGAAVGFASAARRLDRSVDLALPHGIDAGATADLCAHHLVQDIAVRQQALEELDVAARVHLVTRALAEQTAKIKRDRGKLD